MIDKVKVPTFLVSGEYDLFQRGTPLLFENLSKRGVPTKMIIGPWDHLQASSRRGGRQGRLRLADELQLRWFDHYVKGMQRPDARLRHRQPDLLRAGHRRLAQELEVDRPSTEGAKLQALRHVGATGAPGGLTTGARDGRHVDRLPGPGRRALHPLGQPVDRRTAERGARRPAVPRRTTSSTTRPARCSRPGR